MSVGIETTLAQASSVNRPWFDNALVDARGIWKSEHLLFSGKCPLCSSARYNAVAARQDGLPIQECSSCGLAYVDPRPSHGQLSGHYSCGYFSGEKDFFKGKDYCLERDKSIDAGAVTGYREIISNLEIENKVILDVGCATGALLQVLRRHGPKELIGIDSAEHPIAFGRSRYGLDLRRGTVQTSDLPSNHFDLVTLIDVFEHIEDLTTFLQEIKRVLRRAGSVFIITPNYLSHAFAGNEWTCLHKDFEHLQYFSTHSINKICDMTGISLLKLWTDSLPFRTFLYPNILPKGTHKLVHPLTAIRNGIAQYKYKRDFANRPLIGANLNVILQNE